MENDQSTLTDSSGRVAGMIDHSLLKPDAQRDEIVQLCSEAREYGFSAVCVNPTWTALCAELLRGSPVKVCVTVGFPLGATFSEIKADEARRAIELGADEIDLSLNLGLIKAGVPRNILKELKHLRDVCSDKVLKIILECALLKNHEKRLLCQLAVRAKVDFVKTSSGFFKGPLGVAGATVEDVILLRETVGPSLGVKAAGGIRDYATALQLIEAGATRLGTSSGVAIAKEERNITK
jgi:deoxyribose-phosphate aldolase